jgi:hypothetical protein
MNSIKPIRKATIILVVALLVTVIGSAQTKKEKIATDATTAKDEFIKADPKMAGLFEKAYGYAIFLMWARGVSE